MGKMRDFDFVKEMMKKLIYALEQAQVSNQKPEVARSVNYTSEGIKSGGQQFPNLNP
jgi:hypothetical protein